MRMFQVLATLLCGVSHLFFGCCQELSCSGDSLLTRSTTYLPSARLDVRNEPVKTLQDFLDGHSSYVTLSVDSEVITGKLKYGTHVCIPKLNEKYRRVINFEVRDTRQDLTGLGYSRIAIPVLNVSDQRNKDVEGIISVILPLGTLGGSSEEDSPSDMGQPSIKKSASNLREEYIQDYSRERYYHPHHHHGHDHYHYPYPYPRRTTTTTTEEPRPYYPHDYYYRNYDQYRPPPYYYPSAGYNYKYYYHHHHHTTTTTTSAPDYQYPPYYYGGHNPYGSYRRQFAYLNAAKNSRENLQTASNNTNNGFNKTTVVL